MTHFEPSIEGRRYAIAKSPDATAKTRAVVMRNLPTIAKPSLPLPVLLPKARSMRSCRRARDARVFSLSATIADRICAMASVFAFVAATMAPISLPREKSSVAVVCVIFLSFALALRLSTKNRRSDSREGLAIRKIQRRAGAFGEKAGKKPFFYKKSFFLYFSLDSIRKHRHYTENRASNRRRQP